jgi:hypothetical protein
MADILYGVTMQEHGVSKIVSVKFRKSDEPVSEQKAHPLIEPDAASAVEAGEDRPREDSLVLAK